MGVSCHSTSLMMLKLSTTMTALVALGSTTAAQQYIMNPAVYTDDFLGELSNPISLHGVVNVSIGTPPQYLRFNFDTSTTDSFALQTMCPSNAMCPAIYTGPVFTKGDSSTYNTDNITTSTANGSAWQFTGVTSTDRFGVDFYPNATINQTFIATVDGGSTGMYYSMSRMGVLGLGPGNGELSGRPGILSTLLAQVNATEAVVGVYLPQFDFKNVGLRNRSRYMSTPADLGWTFGHLNSEMMEGNMTFVNTTNPNSWTIPVDAVKVNNETLQQTSPLDGSNSTHMTVRVGAPNDFFTTLPQGLIRALYGAIEGANETVVDTRHFLAGKGNVTVYQVPCNTSANVSFTFGGTEFTLKPEDWILRLQNDTIPDPNAPAISSVSAASASPVVSTATNVATPSPARRGEIPHSPELHARSTGAAESGSPAPPPPLMCVGLFVPKTGMVGTNDTWELGTSVLQRMYIGLKFGDQPQVGFAALSAGAANASNSTGTNGFGPGASGSGAGAVSWPSSLAVVVTLGAALAAVL